MKSLVPCGYLDVLAIFRAGNVLPAMCVKSATA